MTYIMTFIALFFTFNSYGLEVFSFGDQIRLSSYTCKETQSIVRSLENWTQKKCKLIDECTYDIKECLPENIANTVGKSSSYEGPNCYNLALNIRGILPALRFSSDEEMAFYLNSPLCRNLAPNEERRPGDVVAIREIFEKKASESHAFIYISPEIAFSKNGMTYESTYDLQRLEDVHASYRITSNEQCRGNQLNLNSTCISGTSYFRCESLDNYLSKQAPLAPELGRLLKEIGIFEKSTFEPFLLNGKKLSDKELQSIVELSKSLFKLAHSKLSDSEKFIVKILDLRLRSISKQLEYAAYSEYSKALESNQINIR